MAFTYLIVNVVFLVCIVVLFMQYLAKPTKSWWITLLILLILTAVFDSILVGMSIVGYNSDRILGIYIGNAPIEDFFYAVMAVVIVPALWNLFDTKKGKTTK
jgi:lycopene cyclase domain-containing protein